MIALLMASAVAAATPAVPSGPATAAGSPDARHQQDAPVEIMRAQGGDSAQFEARRVLFRVPELSIPLSEKGPRLLMGAFGGRGPGMPKLAHVGIGWTF